jgi:hypothetical protein
MRPPQHFFTALDFSKLPGRWVLTVPQRGGPGGAQRPPGATGLLANPVVSGTGFTNKQDSLLGKCKVTQEV